MTEQERKREARKLAALSLFELTALRERSLGGWCIRRAGVAHPVEAESLDAAAVELARGRSDLGRVR